MYTPRIPQPQPLPNQHGDDDGIDEEPEETDEQDSGKRRVVRIARQSDCFFEDNDGAYQQEDDEEFQPSTRTVHCVGGISDGYHDGLEHRFQITPPEQSKMLLTVRRNGVRVPPGFEDFNHNSSYEEDEGQNDAVQDYYQEETEENDYQDEPPRRSASYADPGYNIKSKSCTKRARVSSLQSPLASAASVLTEKSIVKLHAMSKHGIDHGTRKNPYDMVSHRR